MNGGKSSKICDTVHALKDLFVTLDTRNETLESKTTQLSNRAGTQKWIIYPTMWIICRELVWKRSVFSPADISPDQTVTEKRLGSKAVCLARAY